MNFKSIVRFVVLGAALMTGVVTATAVEPALWLRYPAISPDGQTIAFSYRGDLWKVPATGGQATQLTVHAAYEFMPTWSPDGSKIAFASDRYGTSDVFVMPADGGTATRLTYHSASDFPSSFTPDGQQVLFFSGRLDARAMVGYPRRGAQPELYSVALDGGMPRQILTTPAMYAVWDSAGRRLIYSDEKALETDWRKHDNSSFARDVWIYDLKAENTPGSPSSAPMTGSRCGRPERPPSTTCPSGAVISTSGGLHSRMAPSRFRSPTTTPIRSGF